MIYKKPALCMALIAVTSCIAASVCFPASAKGNENGKKPSVPVNAALSVREDIEGPDTKSLQGYYDGKELRFYTGSKGELDPIIPSGLLKNILTPESLELIKNTVLDINFYAGKTSGTEWYFSVSKPDLPSSVVNLCVKSPSSDEFIYSYDIARGGKVTGASFVNHTTGFIVLRHTDERLFSILFTDDQGKTWSKIEIDAPEGFEMSSVLVPSFTPKGDYDGSYQFKLVSQSNSKNIWLRFNEREEKWEWADDESGVHTPEKEYLRPLDELRGSLFSVESDSRDTILCIHQEKKGIKR